MIEQLEQTCSQIDAILALHGLSTKVAGGYVASNGVLLSLSTLLLADAIILADIRHKLNVPDVVATVGVLLLDGRTREDDIIEGEWWGEVDIMDLIDQHEKGVK